MRKSGKKDGIPVSKAFKMESLDTIAWNDLRHRI